MTKQIVRKQLRDKRNALSQQEQGDAELQIALQLKALVTANSNVAGYLANDGEVNLGAAFQVLREQQCKVSLPILHPFRKGYLLFQHFDDNTVMTHNKFNISEPKLSSVDAVAIATLDYILMPLVGFDSQGNRLGMGGGFYDRTLSRLFTLEKPPVLIGIAHDCQQVESLVTEPWDIPLNAIVTPTKTLKISV
jgi:5-formyltetrahydrofolate cyclo-ligase